MNKVALARAISLVCYLGLIAFGLLWVITLGDVPPQQKSIQLIAYAPLLLPLRGILHGRDKAIVWGVLVSLLYMVDGGMLWWADKQHWHWGALELSMAVGFLLFGSFFIRWRAEAQTT